MNIERRTSNIEHRIMISLRSAFYLFFASKFERLILLPQVFTSTLDVGRSMFDVHLLRSSHIQQKEYAPLLIPNPRINKRINNIHYQIQCNHQKSYE